MTVIDSIKSYIPKPVQNAVSSTAKWGKTPIGESPIYRGISNATSNGLTKVAEKAGTYATENAAAEGFIAKWAGKIAGYIAPAAESTKGFLGKMGGVAEGGGLFTKGNAALAALFEAPDIIEGFKEGRGLSQTVQSTAKVGAGIAGGLAAVTGAVALGVLSGPVGWAALAVGAVGGAIGYMAGDKATSFLGHNRKGLFENEQVAAANGMQQTSRQFGQMTMANGAFDLNNPLAGLPPLV